MTRRLSSEETARATQFYNDLSRQLSIGAIRAAESMPESISISAGVAVDVVVRALMVASFALYESAARSGVIDAYPATMRRMFDFAASQKMRPMQQNDDGSITPIDMQ